MKTLLSQLTGHRTFGFGRVATATILLLASLTAAAIAAAPQVKPGTSLQHAAVDIGQTSKFTVTATGEELLYQWRLDGHDLPSQTNKTLTFAPAQPSDEGDYTVEVRNAEGTVVSEPTRLWVVPPAVDFVKDNYTNSAGRRLPYFYLLPANYDPARRYPLMCLLHGAPCDETAITTPNYGYAGLANYPIFKVLASYRQQARDPVILFWPTRRASDQNWTDEYLQLVSGALDRFMTQFNVDTNRVYAGGFSEVFATWDLIGLRPGFFAAACVAAGEQGSTPVASVKEVPFWVWCAADDNWGANGCRSIVQALRQAGANPVYTEYASGGHVGGIQLGMGTPAIVDWMLAQRRGMSSGVEPILSISSPIREGFFTTASPSLNLAGSAEAPGQNVTRVTWENKTNRKTGLAVGTNLWNATGIPLMADKTNVVVVTATTTSWAPAFGGNTTFNDTLTVICSPIRATLALQGPGALLNWAGGVAPYSVQRATDLGKGDWADLLTNAVPPMSLPLDGTAGFYRVVQLGP